MEEKKQRPWMLYHMEFQGSQKYFVVRDFTQLTRKLIELYGPHTKIQGMHVQLIGDASELGGKKEVIVCGR